MEEEAYMTKRDLNRAEVLSRVRRKEISLLQASKEAGLSLRHLQSLYKGFKEHGATSLASKKRGKPSNNKLSASKKARIMET